ncbi:MAG TPA: SGNH/GDSL hydrolase family protein [Pyrinomonadaceae bacterium]
MSNKKSTRAKFLVIIASTLFGLLIAEVALRAIGYSYPNFYTADAVRGNALRPGVEGWYRKEGRAYVRINSEGLRDREHARQKPPGTIRIAVLGDSYAEALQVPAENTFWAVMEERLNQCGALDGRRVEVINFGVSGYGTAQELLTLRERVWEYSPDIVLLAVTTNNDITDNSLALKEATEIPYFVYRDGQLALDNSFRELSTFRLRQSALSRLGRWFDDHLRVVQALHEAQVTVKTLIASRREQRSAPRPAVAQSNPRPESAPPAAEVGIDNLIYREPGDAVWADAWRVTEGLILLMRDEARSRGASFLVVTLSNGIQVHPDRATRQQFAERLGIADLFYPDMRIRSLCQRNEIPVLTLAPALQAYAEQNGVFLHGFGKDIGNGHWNIAGHQLAGELIAGRLCERSD